MTEDDLCTRCLALMREGRSLALSGNRESWSTLDGSTYGFTLRHGDTEGSEVHETVVSEAAAWRLIRIRAEESLSCWSESDRAALPPEAILDHVASQPCADSPSR